MLKEVFQLIGKYVIENGEANQNIDETTSKAEKSSNKISDAFKKIGTAIATYLSATAIKNFGEACITAAADAQAMESQFTQVFGDLEGEAATSLSAIADETGVLENRMKGSYTKIAAFAKTTGMDTADALDLTNRAMIAVADSAAFYDRSLEETTESLQSFLKGNYANDAALGLSCTETTRNAKANELYGKSFQDLSESQKQLTLLAMVEEANELSGAIGQASRESDTWTNQTGNLNQAFTDLKAEIGQYLLPTVIDIVKKFTDFVNLAKTKVEPIVQTISDGFEQLKSWLSEAGEYVSTALQPTFENLKETFDTVQEAIQPIIDKIAEYITSGEAGEDATNILKEAFDFLAEAAEKVTGVIKTISDWCVNNVETIKTIAIVVGSFAAAWELVNTAISIWNTIGVVATTVTQGFSTAVAFLTSPIGIAVVAIGAIIAIIALLIANWDTVKETAINCWNAIVEKFQAAGEWINTNVVTPVVGFFQSMWDGITGIFSGVAEFFSGIFTGAYEAVTGAFSTIGDFFSDVFTTISDIFSTIGSTIGDAVSGAFTSAINWVLEEAVSLIN